MSDSETPLSASAVNPSRGRTIVLSSIALAFVVSFIAVAQHVRCMALGYEVDRAEKRQVELLRRRAIARGRWSTLRAPAQLLRRAEAMGLGLGYPEPSAPAVPGAEFDPHDLQHVVDNAGASPSVRAPAVAR